MNTIFIIILAIFIASAKVSSARKQAMELIRKTARYFYNQGAIDLSKNKQINQDSYRDAEFYQLIEQADNFDSIKQLINNNQPAELFELEIDKKVVQSETVSQKTTPVEVVDSEAIEDELVDKKAVIEAEFESKEPKEPVVTVESVEPIESADNYSSQSIDLLNPNLLLGVGSLLLVAAGVSLIVSQFISNGLKLIIIWAFIGLFYGGGMMLYRYQKRLKPISLAFIGSSLALVPFGGMAFSFYGIFEANISWMIVSLVGILLYGLATVVLRSRVGSYLTIAFVLSMTGSIIYTSNLALFWYFVGFIVLSSLFNLVVYLIRDGDNIFVEPMQHTSLILTPLVLVFSIFASSQLTIGHYQWLCFVAAFKYAADMVIDAKNKHYYEIIIRVLFSVWLSLFIYDYDQTDRLAEVGLVIVLINSILQFAYSMIRMLKTTAEQIEIEWQVTNFLTVLLLIVNLLGLLILMPTQPILLLVSFVAMSLMALVNYLYQAKNDYLNLPLLTGAVLAPLIVAIIKQNNFLAADSNQSVLLGLIGGAVVAVVLIVVILIEWLLKSEAAKIVSFWIYAYLVGLLAVIIWLTVTAYDNILVVMTPLLSLVSLAAITYLARGKNSKLVYLNLIAYWSTGAVLAWHYSGDLPQNLMASLIALVLATIVGANYYLLGYKERAFGTLASQQVVLGVVVLSITGFDGINSYSTIVVSLLTLNGLLLSALAWWKKPKNQSLEQLLLIAPLMLSLLLAILNKISFGATVYLLLTIGLSLLLAVNIISYRRQYDNMPQVPMLLLFWFVYELLASGIESQRLVLTATIMVIFVPALGLYLLTHKNKQFSQQFFVDMILLLAILFVQNYVFSLGDAVYGTIGLFGLIGISAILWIDDYLNQSDKRFEFASYLLLMALTLLIYLHYNYFNYILLAHFWSISIVAISIIKKSLPESLTDGEMESRLTLAYFVTTLAVGFQALIGAGYTLIFLFEQVMLLIMGNSLRYKWLVRYSTVAIALAVMYFVKDIPYLAFGLLGLCLIGFVFWKMTRQKED